MAKKPKLDLENPAVQQVIAALAGQVEVKPTEKNPFEKMDKARIRLGLKKASEKAAKQHTSKTRLTQLAQAREAYFRKMGFGKFRKSGKKAKVAAPIKTKRAAVSKLASAREAYFRKMGYGKYRKAS